MTVFFIAFIAVLLAELGDKTQLVTLTLSTRYPPRQVLAGALGALAAITGLAVVLGDYLADLFPQQAVLLVSGLFFLVVGAYVYFKKESPDGAVEAPTKGVALQTFLMVFLAELGDKTQLAAIALTAAYGQPVAVFLGAMGGQFVNHAAAAYLGSRFLARLPARTIKAASALLFLVFGVAMLISAYR
ncbi:MAG: TMEM165/GDT1 family protein [Bacillota bacterium]|nr:TMEM165/GDT1 family protein [Bacillota bacterium]